jgi:hypothetical protein
MIEGSKEILIKITSDSKLLEKLLIEKSNIEKLIKKTLGNIKNRTHNKREY